MKKILFLMAAAVIAATSCTKEVAVSSAGAEADYTFSVTLPVDATTRATTEDPSLEDMRVFMLISYNGTVVYREKQTGFDFVASDGTDVTYDFDFRLVTGQQYVISAWADFGSDYYDISDAVVGVANPYVDMADKTVNNDNKYDAYFGIQTLTLDGTTTAADMTLTRPFGLVAVYTNDLDAAAVANAGLTSGTYTRSAVAMPYRLYLLDGTVDADTKNVKINDGTCDDDLLSYEYILATDDVALYDLTYTYTIVDAADAEVSTVPYTFNNVPVKRNYKTNVTGSILTEEGDVEISSVDQGWAGTTKVTVAD